MIKWILWFLVLFVPLSVQAADHTITVDVDEPTTNADATNSPLTDLALMQFTVMKSDGTEWIAPLGIPASSLNGGGHHQVTMTVAGFSGQVETGTVTVTAVDQSGNVSTPVSTLVTIDSLMPAPPSNLFITINTTGP